MSLKVFLYVPNIIGYFRIALLLYSCWAMRTQCWHAVLAYALSSLLDAFDGYAARLFNQCSKFGAILDMLTDRCATMCLMACLCWFYPAYMFAFQMCMLVDISSHWLHMHSSIIGGKQTHKTSDNSILRFYYGKKVVIFTLCMGNELFASALYICHFYSGPIAFGGTGLFHLLAYATAPFAVIKFGVNVLQLCFAAITMTAYDMSQDSNTEKCGPKVRKVT